jgi:hypothetical protein
LTNSQKKVLEQIAKRRMAEGKGCYRETRAVFFQLMYAAMSVDPNLTEAEFLREARHEFAKHLQK